MRGTWGGRAQVRKVFYIASVAAIRCNAKIRSFWTRLRAAGKPRRVAVVAIRIAARSGRQEKTNASAYDASRTNVTLALLQSPLEPGLPSATGSEEDA